MLFNNPTWDAATKIQLLERWLIVHSIIYYQLNSNVVEDHVFDANSKQLVDLICNHPEEFKRTKYHAVFKDFDGSTGFNLYLKLEEYDAAEAEYVHHIAAWTLNKYANN